MNKNNDRNYVLQIISSALITMGAVSFGAGFTIFTLSTNPDPNWFLYKGWGAMILGIVILSLGIFVPLKFRHTSH